MVDAFFRTMRHVGKWICPTYTHPVPGVSNRGEACSAQCAAETGKTSWEGGRCNFCGPKGACCSNTKKGSHGVCKHVERSAEYTCVLAGEKMKMKRTYFVAQDIENDPTTEFCCAESGNHNFWAETLLHPKYQQTIDITSTDKGNFKAGLMTKGSLLKQIKVSAAQKQTLKDVANQNCHGNMDCQTKRAMKMVPPLLATCKEMDKVYDELAAGCPKSIRSFLQAEAKTLGTAKVAFDKVMRLFKNKDKQSFEELRQCFPLLLVTVASQGQIMSKHHLPCLCSTQLSTVLDPRYYFRVVEAHRVVPETGQKIWIEDMMKPVEGPIVWTFAKSITRDNDEHNLPEIKNVCLYEITMDFKTCNALPADPDDAFTGEFSKTARCNCRSLVSRAVTAKMTYSKDPKYNCQKGFVIFETMMRSLYATMNSIDTVKAMGTCFEGCKK